MGIIEDQQALVDAINEGEDWTRELNVDGDSYDFLESVWRNPRAPFAVRKHAAVQCLAYDRPKLAVIGHVAEDGSFAERLDRALSRSGMKPPSTPPKLIEYRPEPEPE